MADRAEREDGMREGEREKPGWALREALLLASVVGIALALRVVGLRWGLPNTDHYFSYHPDEIQLLDPAYYRFARGNWNPGFFNYGTLYIYLVGLPAVVFGLVPGPGVYPAGLAPLYLLGRAITCALGTASVPLLYLALRSESRKLALLSAGLLALCPLHIVTSHYATVDVPATFWLTLAFLLTLRGCQRPGAGTGFAAGLAVGLAAATKYNAGLFIIPAVAAPMVPPRARTQGMWWLRVVGGAAIGFLIGCPYLWSEEFLPGLLSSVHLARVGGTFAFVEAGSGWVYHIARGLPVGLGFPLALAAAVGVAFALRRRSRAARLSVLWVALYLLVIGFGREWFSRYLVPLAPFLCLLAACALSALLGAARRMWSRAAAGALVGALVVLTGLYAVGQVVPFVWPDARDRVWSSSDPAVRSARVGLAQRPWYFHPPVSPYNAGAYSGEWFEAWNEAAGHPVEVITWNAETNEQAIKALEASAPDVFCLSDLESVDLVRLHPETAGFVSALERVYRDSRTYREPPTPMSWLAPRRELAPPDWLYPSPRITVYYNPRP